MELYDMAKQIAAQDTPMDPIIFNQTMLAIGHDMERKEYIMLLCNERRDFTIFHLGEYCDEVQWSDIGKMFAKDLSDTLVNRGQVLYADRQKDGAWEIWIRNTETKENFAYYLFDYGDAIVEVGKE